MGRNTHFSQLQLSHFSEGLPDSSLSNQLAVLTEALTEAKLGIFATHPQGKHSSIVEISVTCFLFFWRNSPNFFSGVGRILFSTKFFLGVSHVKILGGGG